MTTSGPTKSAIIWTNGKNVHAMAAKHLLIKNKISVEVRDISSNWTKAQLLEAIPGVTSLPQIIMNNVVIGGLKELTALDQFKPEPLPTLTKRTFSSGN